MTRYKFYKKTAKKESRSPAWSGYNWLGKRARNTITVLVAAFLSAYLGTVAGRAFYNSRNSNPANLETKVESTDKSSSSLTLNKIIDRDKKKILIDPGHGGRDPGACHPLKGSVFKESDIVLQQSLAIQKLLEEKGYGAYLIRQGNNYVSHKKRVDMAKRLDANIFVSLHCNSFRDPSAYGQLVIYGDREGNRELEIQSKLLGEYIHRSLVKKISEKYKTKGRGVQTDLGVRKEPLEVLYTKCPSVIVEPGFLSNANDRQFLTDPNLIGPAIADGVHQYFLRKEHPEKN